MAVQLSKHINFDTFVKMESIEMYHLKFIAGKILDLLQTTYNGFKSIDVLSVQQTDLFSKLQESLSVANKLTKCEFISKMNTEKQIVLFEGFQRVEQQFKNSTGRKRDKLRLKFGLYEPISVTRLNECTSFHFEIATLIFSFLENEKRMFKLAIFGMSTIVNTIIETVIQFNIIISISCEPEMVTCFQEKARRWAFYQLELPAQELTEMIKQSNGFHGNYIFNCEFLCREAVRRINSYSELDIGMKFWLIEIVNEIKRRVNDSPLRAFNKNIAELELALSSIDNLSVQEKETWLKIATESEIKVASYFPRYVTETEKLDLTNKFRFHIRKLKREKSSSKPEEEKNTGGPGIFGKIEQTFEKLGNK